MRIGFLGLLTLLFVGFKLAGVLMWSWWLVLAPLFFGVTVTLLIFALYVWANWKKL